MRYLKIHTLKSNQWYDKDELLLHGAFQILIDFVQDEKPFNNTDWSHDKESRKARSEIEKLYRWWKSERSARIDPLESVEAPPCEEFGLNKSGQWVPLNEKRYPNYAKALRESWALEEQWYKEDTNNLARLIKIRCFLWT